MKDWFVAFIAATFLVSVIVWCLYIFIFYWR